MRCIRQWAAFDRAVVVKQVDTNAVGDVRVTQAALPLDHESENLVVVNTSSGLGANGAGHTVAEGAEVIVRLATIGKDGASPDGHQA